MTPISLEQLAEALLEHPTSAQHAQEFVSALRGPDGLFAAHEDTFFDYKRDFPTAVNDEYFAAIVRLTLAFHNSFGGVIVFNVDDKSRTIVASSTSVGTEKFNTRLRELTDRSLNIRHLAVHLESGSINLLMVPRRPANEPPVSLLTPLSNYPAGTIWLRRGHEVLVAQSRDLQFLFSARESHEPPQKIQSFLPPPPSTIDHFVGRVDVLSKLLTWLATSDEPRLFLWGRGGSGKSTVAYEFAQIIRDHGSRIVTVAGDTVDRVIYLSAKQRELDTQTGQIRSTAWRDFANYEELLVAILIASDYSATEDFTSLSRTALEQRVKEVFEHEAVLLVLDDVDTLTTAGLEAGFDSLYKMSIRAKRTIRILYTQRNLPSSSESAVQVPGFTREQEYNEFVVSCCRQFEVPKPDQEYVDGALREATECIPLIVETLIGLRRVCGNYTKAHAIFMEKQGDEARRYLFEREYHALPADNNARHVLAAIAEFSRPVGNAEVGTIVRIGEALVAESIGQVLGFFLSSIVSVEGETQYFLNPVTRSFIKASARELSFWPVIVERVKAFKSAGRNKPQEVVVIESQVDSYVARGQLREARTVLGRQHAARIVESPAFRMMRGVVYTKSGRDYLSEARDDFQYCVDQGYEDADGMRAWYNFEWTAGQSHNNQIAICDRVIASRAYADDVKFEFYSRRAVAYFFKSRDAAYSDAYNLLAKALSDHVLAYNYVWENGRDANWNFKNTRNTGFALLLCGRNMEYDSTILRTFRDIHSLSGALPEPLFDPFSELVSFLGSARGGDVGRRRSGLLRTLLKDFQKGQLCFRKAEMSAALINQIVAGGAVAV